MKIAVIILTYNEEIHIQRCIKSIREFLPEILVVDSFSNDQTVKIAEQLGARVLQHKFENHALQFNWAITQLDSGCNWVIRLDADEYFTPELVHEINNRLPSLPVSVNGVHCYRRVNFAGRLMRFAGLYKIKMLRIWRYGTGKCENRWMDEHIIVSGNTVDFNGAIIDHNLKSLTYWTDKHNGYASREAVDLLNMKHHLFAAESISQLNLLTGSSLKRWMKENLYARFPLGVRSILFFVYRYIFLLGFLDGAAGFKFNFLQCLWYRFLVDMKIDEVETYKKLHNVTIIDAINKVLNINLDK